MFIALNKIRIFTLFQPNFRFSTLQILQNNAQSINLINPKNKKSKNITIKNQSNYLSINSLQQLCINQKKEKLLPYNTARYQYLHSFNTQANKQTLTYLYNSIHCLDHFEKYLRSNPHLSTYKQIVDIEDFVLIKVIHIALSQIEKDAYEGKKQQKDNNLLWGTIAKRIVYLFRNTSVQDNIMLAYIAFKKSQYFQAGFIDSIVRLLMEQLKFMAQQEKQITFYMLTKLQNKHNHRTYIGKGNNKNQIVTERIQKLKSQITISLQNMKLSQQSIINWIALHSICNPSDDSIVSNYINRLLTLKKPKKQTQNTNNQTKKQTLKSILACLEHRRVLSQSRTNNYFLNLIKQINKQYPIIKQQAQPSQIIDDIRLKMYLSLSNIHDSKLQLTEQQLLLNNVFSLSEQFRYIYELWRNDLKQLYELKSLYQSLDVQIKRFDGLCQEMAGIQLIYYMVMLEIIVGSRKNQSIIFQWLKRVKYLPRGLQWPVYNYLALIAKQHKNNNDKITNIKTEIKQIDQQFVIKDSAMNQQIQQILTNLSKNYSLYNKYEALTLQIKKQQSNHKKSKQLSKFFKAVKIWDFQEYSCITPAHYICQFLNRKHKIIIKCLEDYDNQNNNENKNIQNNEVNMQRKLLLENYGYDMIIFDDVSNFLELDYNDRVGYLQKQIAEILNRRRKQLLQ